MKLLIFTQKVDSDDSNLGFFHEWVIEFSKKFETVKVICLFKGQYDLPKNVEVFSLGKENGVSSFGQLVRLYKYVLELRGQYDQVFVHMNPVYLVLCGWYFKLKKIPVYMWYVHKSVDLKLKIATFFSKKVFTSARESFRLPTNKVVYLGHGIAIDGLPNTPHVFTGGKLKLVHVGRITEIKHIEIAIIVLNILAKDGVDSELDLYGECETESDKIYKDKMESLATQFDLKNKVNFIGGIKHRDLASRLRESHIALNMTPQGGMDKAVLEALILGLPVFTANTAFTDVFSTTKDLFLYTYRDAENLASKIKEFLSLNNGQLLINDLSNSVRQNYSLPSLVTKIVDIIKQ